jgi:lipid-binding SYLF domain-containing protein
MIKKISLAICLSTALTLSAHAADQQKLDQRVQSARDVLHELMATPDKGIPDDIAAHATCVAVVPGVKKAAFVVGAQYGQGVVSCRTGDHWSAPVFIQISGASFGLQIGGEDTDLVLIGMSRNSFDRLLADKIKLGGDIAVAAGPVGRNSQMSTTELANAGFLAYSRNKGLFAGINLSGDVVNQNHDDTAAFYGHEIPFREILSGAVPPPAPADPFVHSVAELFHAHNDHPAGE